MSDFVLTQEYPFSPKVGSLIPVNDSNDFIYEAWPDFFKKMEYENNIEKDGHVDIVINDRIDEK